MTKKYIVERYFCKPKEVESDMNKYHEKGYYPKEIKLGNHQGLVDATIIYKLEELE